MLQKGEPALSSSNCQHAVSVSQYDNTAMTAGYLLLCLTLHSQVASCCFGCQRAGRLVQQTDRTGRPDSCTHLSKGTGNGDRGLAASFQRCPYRCRHAADIIPLESQEKECQIVVKLHQVWLHCVTAGTCPSALCRELPIDALVFRHRQGSHVTPCAVCAHA